MSGLLLFVICWSGTIATLSQEIDWLLNADIRIKAQSRDVGYAELYASLREAYPEGNIVQLDAPIYANAAAQALVETENGQFRRVYLDPYTAEIYGSTSYFNVQRFFRSFHMSLFNPFGLGYWAVTIVSIPLIGSLVAGLFFYKRWWRRFWKLKLVSGVRALWSSTHKLVGLWSLWFVIVIGLTGIWYLFEVGRLDVGDGKVVLTEVGPEERRHAVATLVLPESHATPLSFEELLQRARDERSGLTIRSIRPAGEHGFFYVDGQDDHILVRDRANKLYLDQVSGSVIYDQSASDLSLYWRWVDTADQLHFGNFGGIWTKLIWFVFGIGLSGLSLTGAWLHVKRLERNKRGRIHRNSVIGAASVTHLILGASVWSGIAEIRSYGPIIDGAQEWPSEPVGVWLFISVWIVLTIAILASFSVMLCRTALKRQNPKSVTGTSKNTAFTSQ